MTIEERIAGVRAAMAEAGVHAFVCADVDPHQSEYVPDRYRTRSWITGFTGSAGIAVVTRSKAGLWTDSRYYLEAERVLADTPVQLFRDGTPGVPGYAEWIASELSEGEVLALDDEVTSVTQYRSLRQDCRDSGLEIRIGVPLPGGVWTESPALPSDPIFLHEERFCGRSRRDKIADVRKMMAARRITVLLVTALDDVAWLYNIRGSDVAYNPVATGYAVVTVDGALLFMDPRKIPAEVRRSLERDGIEVRDYNAVYGQVEGVAPGTVVGLWPEKTGHRLYSSVPDGARIVEETCPVARLKARKNPVEQESLRRTMVKDGVALERFFYWLERTAPEGDLDEIAVAEKLREFRRGREHFVGESFATIAGFGPHGAIVHYSASPETAARIESDGLLLIDSGGQYLDGTTDITRVVSIGRPSAAAVRDYTVVLKAHIALATVEFPEGTTGSQLDSIARERMWRHGLFYGHGTGHGVGFFLNVHEGPQRFGSQANPVALEPGMYTSNEPGVYREGVHGIRIENLVLVQPGMETDFGRFYRLETITLCHLERDLIDPELLSDEEIEWVNGYHAMVDRLLSPALDPEVAEWLAGKTAPISRRGN